VYHLAFDQGSKAGFQKIHAFEVLYLGALEPDHVVTIMAGFAGWTTKGTTSNFTASSPSSRYLPLGANYLKKYGCQNHRPKVSQNQMEIANFLPFK
jgi:hypothetical protein